MAPPTMLKLLLEVEVEVEVELELPPHAERRRDKTTNKIDNRKKIIEHSSWFLSNTSLTGSRARAREPLISPNGTFILPTANLNQDDPRGIIH